MIFLGFKISLYKLWFFIQICNLKLRHFHLFPIISYFLWSWYIAFGILSKTFYTKRYVKLNSRCFGLLPLWGLVLTRHLKEAVDFLCCEANWLLRVPKGWRLQQKFISKKGGIEYHFWQAIFQNCHTPNNDSKTRLEHAYLRYQMNYRRSGYSECLIYFQGDKIICSVDV